MAKTPRTFTPEFKAERVLEYLTGAKSVAAICREHTINQSVLYRWKDAFVANAPRVFADSADTDPSQARIAELERMLGRLTVELEVAKKGLSHLRQHPPSGEPRS